jgi:ABC-type protease/lipase transport system fused ATPase/permease subunit
LGGALTSHYATEDLGRNVGCLPQDAQLLSGTIAENISRMSVDADSGEIVKAAVKAKAHEFILSLPDGTKHEWTADAFHCPAVRNSASLWHGRFSAIPFT